MDARSSGAEAAPEMTRRGRPPWLRLPAFCLLLVAPSLVYLAARLTVPGDGALVDLLRAPARGQGVLIGELVQPETGLQPGDQLLAIDGISLDDWFGFALRAGRGQPANAVHAYAVVRGGSEQAQIEVRWAPSGVASHLRSNWPSFLFLAYLLVVAAVIYARRPEIAAARTLLLASSAIFASGSIFFTGLQASDLTRGWPFWLFLWGSLLVYGFSMGAILHFSLTFPRVRNILRSRAQAVWLIYTAVWVPYLTAVGVGWLAAPSASNRFLIAMRAAGLFTALCVPLGVGILLTGYLRNFNARERRQTRWLLWSGTVILVPWIGLSVVPSLFGAAPIVPQFTLGLLFLLLPTSFAIAIARESLFDIDYLINRTLVYALLSVVLVSVYFGIVVALQQLFEALTGQQTPLAMVFSTLVIAAIFNPLRVRIQALIDRRFYRSRYDAVRALNQLSLQMAQQVELAELSHSVMNIVQDSLQPMHMSLWLHRGEAPR